MVEVFEWILEENRWPHCIQYLIFKEGTLMGRISFGGESVSGYDYTIEGVSIHNSNWARLKGAKLDEIKAKLL